MVRPAKIYVVRGFIAHSPLFAKVSDQPGYHWIPEHDGTGSCWEGIIPHGCEVAKCLDNLPRSLEQSGIGNYTARVQFPHGPLLGERGRRKIEACERSWGLDEHFTNVEVAERLWDAIMEGDCLIEISAPRSIEP